MKKKNLNGKNLTKKGGAKIKYDGNDGFGVNEIIGLSAGLIIAAVIVVPGLRTFAQTIMNELSMWWENVVLTIFV